MAKLKALQSSAEAKKAAAAPAAKRKVPPQRILIFGGAAVALVIIILLFFFSVPRKEVPPGAPPQSTPQATAPSPGSVSGRTAASPPGLIPADISDRPAIQAIRFQPPRPTRADTLKAEVIPSAAPDPGRFTYAYVWKVNDRIIEGAAGDTLVLSAFKKRDLVTVTVTPYDGEKAGFPVESPMAFVYGIPPTLDLKEERQARKAGEPAELQLISLHPDSEEGVTFSLEAPIVPGMSIDGRTGRITWIIQPDQKGTIRFGAAVEDADKTKVTRTFDLTIG